MKTTKLSRQNNIDNLTINLSNTEDQLTEILIYLSSDKFAGQENNFVNASEIYNRINLIRNNIKY